MGEITSFLLLQALVLKCLEGSVNYLSNIFCQEETSNRPSPFSALPYFFGSTSAIVNTSTNNLVIGTHHITYGHSVLYFMYMYRCNPSNRLVRSACTEYLITLTNFSESPLHLLTMVEADILKNVVLHSVATALANRVLPVPDR